MFVQEQFDRHWSTYGDGRPGVLVACSGGPDSVALLRLLHDGTTPTDHLFVAHFNHQLRGADADRDEQFVTDLCHRLGRPLHTGRADQDEIDLAMPGQGMEAALRQCRYRFLVQTAEAAGIRYVATGHTADDQVETVLHNLLRGTGLAGLAGIPVVRSLSPAVSLVRPLLPFRRKDLVAHLKEIGQDYCRDASNDESRFLRNRIRHELLPLLESDYYPGVRDSLTNLAAIARDAQLSLRQSARAVLEQSLRSAGPDACSLDCPTLSAAQPHLRREAFVCLWQRQAWSLQSMTFAHWQRLSEMALNDNRPSAMDLPGAIRARRRDGQLDLTRIHRNKADQ